MANFEINEDQAALIRELRKLETSDPVHANVYNALFEKLINNDAFLERLANKMIEKSMLCHVLDSVNAQQVLAADVGPKITAIIDGLQEDVNGLNTKIADTSGIANTANAKIELDGPIKTIAYGSDKNKWAFQQQFPDGVILSLGISETEIFYDYYDGKTWTRKWTR